MWMVDDINQDHFLIFQDGDLFETTDTAFVNAVNEYVTSKIKKEGIASVEKVDFQTVSDNIATVQQLCSLCDMEINPNKGIISFSYSQIIVEKDSVKYKNHYDDKYGTEMKRISDKADFTGIHFTELFENTVRNYTAPLSTVFSTEEYLKCLKIMNPSINNWILVDDGENSKLYTSDGKIKNSPGFYILSDNSLMYSYGKKYDGTAAFYLEYGTDAGLLRNGLFLCDYNGAYLYDLLDYISVVLENFPGALTKDEIVALYEENYTVSSGARSFKTTKNGIDYIITKTTDGKSTIISINLPKGFKLGSLPMTESVTKPNTIPTTTPTTAPTTKPTTTFTAKPNTGSNQGAQDPCAMGHNYQNGVCKYCGALDPFYDPCAMGHTYENGYCIYCMAKN